MAEITLTKDQIENINALGAGVAAAFTDALLHLKYDGFHPQIVAALVQGVQSFFHQDVDAALHQMSLFRTGACKNYHAQMMHAIMAGGLVRTLNELICRGVLDDSEPVRSGSGERREGPVEAPDVDDFEFRLDRGGNLN